jgi:hypothetical protein
LACDGGTVDVGSKIRSLFIVVTSSVIITSSVVITSCVVAALHPPVATDVAMIQIVFVVHPAYTFLASTTQQRIMHPSCSIGRAVASAAFEDFVSAS